MKNKTLATFLGSLQVLLKNHFGKKRISLEADYGQQTLHISNSRVELTDEGGSIVARGPAKVATVLRRKIRK
jgi:hypothetical protein